MHIKTTTKNYFYDRKITTRKRATKNKLQATPIPTTKLTK